MTVSTPTYPTHPSEDRLVRQHVAQRQGLETKLADAQRRVAALIDEQKALEKAAHQRNVNKLLDLAAPGEKNSASRIVQIADEIATETATVRAATEALDVNAVLTAGVRERAQLKFANEIKTAARELVDQMGPHGAALFALTAEVRRLVDLVPHLRMPAPPEAFLVQFFDQIGRLASHEYR